MTSLKLVPMSFAAVALFVAQPALAGDNDGEYYNDGVDVESYDDRSPDRYGERITRRDKYEDDYQNGYRDGHNRGYKDDYAERDHQYRDDHYGRDKGHYGSYKDDVAPPREPPRSILPRYRHHKYRRYADGHCIPRRMIRRGLRRQGWRRIRVLAIRGPVIRVKARNRYRRRPYVLALDRCTGEVMAARPLPRGHFRGRRFSRRFH